MDGPLGKTKYYALRVEFQERGSPHVHAFIWILNAPKIGNETEYIAFTEKKASVQIYQTQWNNLNFLNLLNYIRFILMQGHLGNIKRTNADFQVVDFLQIEQ